ncbi:hypothetical protein [Arthrobacter sp. SD76]|uniref:hypothetical protein n=1 Tax=Arthrobacter sp. SD76 TaxID=3415007 RepID=UPI003C76D63B
MGSNCGACDNLPDGIYLCHACTEKLERDLRDVPATVDALWASAARMDVGNGTVGSSGHSSPTAPTNSRAYDAGRTLNVILTGWADTLGHTEPHAVRAAAVLLTRIREVRAADWAPDLKRELREVLWQCDAVMDRKPRKVFAGICPILIDGAECGTPTYTPEGRAEATCKACGFSWDVVDWRVRALHAAGHRTGTAAEVSRILSDPARNIILRQNTIRVWVAREKLVPVGTNEKGAPVFQIRKVRNLWERQMAKNAARAERMAA